ncbi:FAD-binding oxidoreductase [Sporolactobacillus kofuensis]|uniref:FAD-binding oxidoreductase n=1 Tax=Sporolactobacillus kofuensis TaxID=269672 RepID=A0ABW1WF32_9BACL|nr:ferredoxin reductase family protein [Sporolactobacillus kofuensis]MCO7174976.1 FAD-binding oxidoreductase [Sporolactobacillus kofuensis]
MIKIMRSLFILIYLFSPLPAIYVVYSSDPTAYQTMRGLLPMILGTIAYTWLMAELVISARPKFIERFFGLNHFYQFHGAAAIMSIMLSLLHKQLEDAIWGHFLHTVRQIGDLALILFIVLASLSLFFMTRTIIRRIPFLETLRSFLEQKLHVDFKYSVWIHNANVIAIVLVFAHVFMLSAFYQRNIWICSIYTLYFAIAFGYYVNHKFIKQRYAMRKHYRVTAIINESPNVHTFVFTRIKGKIPRYKAGQFIFLRFLTKELNGEEHPFSITSNPRDRYHLSVTIKSVGDFTRAISRIPLNTQVMIEGPFGILGNSVRRHKTDIALVAGGIGITPMISILKDIKQTYVDRRVLLIWCVPTRKELMFHDLINDLSAQMPHFSFVPILSREIDELGESGHLNQEKMQRLLATYHYHPKRTDYIICGPSKMMESVTHILHCFHVHKKNIHLEDFSL